LEVLLHEFAGSEQQLQSSRDLDPDASILLLIVRGLCHRICRKDIFGLYSKCKAETKNISALLTHLDKKYELRHMRCKNLMRHFIPSPYPGRIDTVPKIGDGATVDRLWDVERCPCLGSNDYHNKHDNIEIHAKVHKQMYANMDALGWLWDSIRIMVQNSERITIREAIGESPAYQFMVQNAGRYPQ
jgi:hypothetical protein